MVLPTFGGLVRAIRGYALPVRSIQTPTYSAQRSETCNDVLGMTYLFKDSCKEIMKRNLKKVGYSGLRSSLGWEP